MHILQTFAVNGTIGNFSTINFSGNTPQLQWGKWTQSPTFPVKAQSVVTFSACGVSIALQYLSEYHNSNCFI